MALRCFSCGRKIGGWGHYAYECQDCGLYFCGHCIKKSSGLFKGKCPECGGTVKLRT